METKHLHDIQVTISLLLFISILTASVAATEVALVNTSKLALPNNTVSEALPFNEVSGLKVTDNEALQAPTLLDLSAQFPRPNARLLAKFKNKDDDAIYTRVVWYDYDGDGYADFGKREFSSGEFDIKSGVNGTSTRYSIGLEETDIPVAGDFDGDGKFDPAVRRPTNGYWYIKNSSGIDIWSNNANGITRIKFGLLEGDIPVPADYDGDGITDIAVRRPANGAWYIKNSSGIDPINNSPDGITRIAFGFEPSDIPVPADYDGDGKADIAVRRPSRGAWYIRNSLGFDPIGNNSSGLTSIVFGSEVNDIPVPADYDGDGRADIAVRRPAGGMWFIKNSAGADLINNTASDISRVFFGSRFEDVPVPADYDADGKADIAVRRPSKGTWFVLNSGGVDNISNNTNGISRFVFGENTTDLPVAAPISNILDILGRATDSNVFICKEGVINLNFMVQNNEVGNPDEFHGYRDFLTFINIDAASFYPVWTEDLEMRQVERNCDGLKINYSWKSKKGYSDITQWVIALDEQDQQMNVPFERYTYNNSYGVQSLFYKRYQTNDENHLTYYYQRNTDDNGYYAETVRTYHENGNVKSVRRLIDKDYYGVQANYDEQGEKNGAQYQIYTTSKRKEIFESGVIRRSTNYNMDNEKHGYEYIYDEDGRLVSKTLYRNGLPV